MRNVLVKYFQCLTMEDMRETMAVCVERMHITTSDVERKKPGLMPNASQNIKV